MLIHSNDGEQCAEEQQCRPAVLSTETQAAVRQAFQTLILTVYSRYNIGRKL